MNELIKKFWAGEASIDERKALLNSIDKEEDLWRQQLRTEFDDDLTARQMRGNNDRLNIILAKLHEEIYTDKEKTSFVKIRTISPLIRWVAAAVLIISFGLGLYHMTSTKNSAPYIANRQTVHPDQYTYLSAINSIKLVQLPDGSTVTIYPGSKLKYQSSFNHTVRNINLDAGNALFKVAKNPKKPFTVYANGISTTALGTKFNVDISKRNHVTVKLFEGKVVVRSIDEAVQIKDAYLIPGQLLMIDRAQNTAKISTIAEDETTNEYLVSTGSADQLIFKKAPLSEVFNRLSIHYHTKIIYNRAMLKGLSFTGKFRPTDSLNFALKTLCSLNNLSYIKGKKAVIINKK